jgi:hypothetical protein
MPYLNCSAGCQIRVKKSVGNRCPLLKSESISTRRFRLAERGSLLFPTNRGRQLFTALGASASQHLAAVLGRHPRAEAVIVQSFAIRWLKRSFHYSCLLLKQLYNITTSFRPSRHYCITRESPSYHPTPVDEGICRAHIVCGWRTSSCGNLRNRSWWTRTSTSHELVGQPPEACRSGSRPSRRSIFGLCNSV